MNPIIARVAEAICEIQQIPAPTFHEQERAEYMRQRFFEEGLADIAQDVTGNVYARLPGSGAARPLVVSAHLDTVFPFEVDLRLDRQPGHLTGPGVGDNAAGLAGLLALAWSLRERGLSLPGDLWLAADVCEEGLGDLRGMKAVVERFGSAPRAYIVLEGMALGHVYHRALGVRRYRITVQTGGGHSWIDYGKPSAVHVLTRLAAGITGLQVPAAPRTSLNVGRICGGTSVNTIAPQASLELDLRSEDPGALLALAGQVEALAHASEQAGVEMNVEVIGQRPAGEIPASHPLVGLACACLKELDIVPTLNIGSTDANIPLSRGLPAVAIGLTHGSGGHTVHESIELDPLEKGLALLVGLASRCEV